MGQKKKLFRVRVLTQVTAYCDVLIEAPDSYTAEDIAIEKANSGHYKWDYSDNEVDAYVNTEDTEEYDSDDRMDQE